MYEHIKTEYPKARKDYRCDAWDWLNEDIDYTREVINNEDEIILDKAISEKCMIRKGDKYVKHIFKFDGEIQVTKNRIDLDKICTKYKLYSDGY